MIAMLVILLAATAVGFRVFGRCVEHAGDGPVPKISSTDRGAKTCQSRIGSRDESSLIGSGVAGHFKLEARSQTQRGMPVQV